MILHLLIYLLSFAGIWIGSGFVVGSVQRISRSLRMSTFAVSFLVLGLFTSMSELSVGVNSIIENQPEIYVGNLIGATIVLLLLIIPLLAIIGGSIKIAPEFRGFNLPASLVVIALPAVLAMDGVVGRTDSLIVLALFGFLLISVESKRGFVNKLNMINRQTGVRFSRELLKIIFGVAVIFVAGHFVVEQTYYFSTYLGVSPFLISLLLIAIGTNVPELSLVLRSAFVRNHQVAFGDYIGSAAFNTFFFGFLTLIYGKPVVLSNDYFVSLVFLVIGLILFYYYSRTKHAISRHEGVVLLLLYIAFLFVEIARHTH